MIFGQKSIIGIDIEEDAIRACALIRKGDRVYLNSYKSAKGLKDFSFDPSFKGRSVVVSLPTQVLLFRTFIIGTTLLKSKDQQKSITGFLERQNLPLKLNDCFWNTFILNGSLNLVAARKDTLNKYLAPLRESGFNVAGVIPTFAALYNLLIYNYTNLGNFALLNVRNLSSDILIFENKRIWIYPLPMGRQHLKDNTPQQATFSQEVYRIFNTHYLQNPAQALPRQNRLHISGIDASETLVSSLKKALVDYEIINLEPLKRVIAAKKIPVLEPQGISLSIGLGITFLELPRNIRINLIEEDVKREHVSARVNSLLKTTTYLGAAIALLLLFLNVKLVMDLKKKHSIFKTAQFQATALLPELKSLKEERQKLQALEYFLERKLNQQALYLKALGVISESKSPLVQIKELEISAKAANLEVFLLGAASSYDEINAFLGNLKKNQDIKDVKVVASTFPDAKAEDKAVEVKLRFEID